MATQLVYNICHDDLLWLSTNGVNLGSMSDAQNLSFHVLDYNIMVVVTYTYGLIKFLEKYIWYSFTNQMIAVFCWIIQVNQYQEKKLALLET